MSSKSNSKGVTFDSSVPDPDSTREAPLPDAYSEDVDEEEVDPALDLVRTMSMSTDKDILKQLRDAMNPNQKQQTVIMLLQAGM